MFLSIEKNRSLFIGHVPIFRVCSRMPCGTWSPTAQPPVVLCWSLAPLLVLPSWEWHLGWLGRWISFFLGQVRPIFKGELLVSGRVSFAAIFGKALLLEKYPCKMASRCKIHQKIGVQTRNAIFRHNSQIEVKSTSIQPIKKPSKSLATGSSKWKKQPTNSPWVHFVFWSNKMVVRRRMCPLDGMWRLLLLQPWLVTSLEWQEWWDNRLLAWSLGCQIGVSGGLPWIA